MIVLTSRGAADYSVDTPFHTYDFIYDIQFVYAQPTDITSTGTLH